MATKELKAALRLEMKSIRLTSREREPASRQICVQLQKLEEYREATAVLLFAPLPDEPDLLSLMDDRKQFCFPQFQTDDSYAAAIVDSPDSMITGKFGILEPPANVRMLGANEIDLIIIPGVAFGKDCHRLGRGRGYYDRWLGELSGFKVGACFEHQLVDSVPVEKHDIQLDCVLSPTKSARKKKSN